MIEMKLEVDIGADGLTLVEITDRLHQVHPEMEFMTCDSGNTRYLTPLPVQATFKQHSISRLLFV